MKKTAPLSSKNGGSRQEDTGPYHVESTCVLRSCHTRGGQLSDGGKEDFLEAVASNTERTNRNWLNKGGLEDSSRWREIACAKSGRSKAKWRAEEKQIVLYGWMHMHPVRPLSPSSSCPFPRGFGLSDVLAWESCIPGSS